MTVVSPWLDISEMICCQCSLKRILLGLSRQFMLTPLNLKMKAKNGA